MNRARAAILALALGGCQARSACPAAYHPDRAREVRIDALLTKDPEARTLLDRSRGRVRSCFAPGAAGVSTGEVFLLDQNLDDARLAARSAHLLAHRAAGVVASSGDATRPDEVDANALEARVLSRARRGEP